MKSKLGEITLKEINQQPDSFQGVITNISEICSKVKRIFIEHEPEKVIFMGCGTSYYLAQSALSIFSKYNEIPAQAVVSSEIIFNGEQYIKNKKVLLIPITRDSKTTEVRRALEVARNKKNVISMAVTCDLGSAEINDYFLFSPKAEEKSIVMTSSFSSMLYIILVISLCLAGKNKEIEKIKQYPFICENLLKRVNRQTEKIVEENKNINLFIFLGQGSMYGIACEAMLKIKEMCISNSEAYHSLEFRHGPISLLKPGTFITLFITKKAINYELQLVETIKNLGAKAAIVCGKKNKAISENSDYVLETTDLLDDYLRTPLNIIPIHCLSYHYSISKGIDVDKPRNLNRAVILS